jgi:hypothetical protein
MSNDEEVKQPISNRLRRAIVESGVPFASLERETGVERATIQRFVDRTTSLRLDAADRLAVFFKFRLTRKGAQCMSMWEEFQVEQNVRQILAAQAVDTRYGAGRPYLTAYQIAVEYKAGFRANFGNLQMQMGGARKGPYGLPTYLARELAGRIKDGRIRDMQIAFLGYEHIKDLIFDDEGRDLKATTAQARWGTTLFRLKSETGE